MLLFSSYEYQNNTTILQSYYFQISLSLRSGDSWQKSDEGARAGGGGGGGQWKERLRQDAVILKSDDPQYHDCKCQITSNQNLPQGIKCQTAVVSAKLLHIFHWTNAVGRKFRMPALLEYNSEKNKDN